MILCTVPEGIVLCTVELYVFHSQTSFEMQVYTCSPSQQKKTSVGSSQTGRYHMISSDICHTVHTVCPQPETTRHWVSLAGTRHCWVLGIPFRHQSRGQVLSAIHSRAGPKLPSFWDIKQNCAYSLAVNVLTSSFIFLFPSRRRSSRVGGQYMPISCLK